MKWTHLVGASRPFGLKNSNRCAIETPDGFRAELQIALTAHINHWQNILQSCGLKARADTTTHSDHPARPEIPPMV